MAYLVIKDLVKRFGKTVAVDHLTLDVNEGEMVCLLGPSGCGKTTTLRCIAGLEEPDEGEIYIGGELVNYLPPQERDVALVFQSFALYPHMTVFENMAFPLIKKGYSKQAIELRIKEIASMLRIDHLLDRNPATLSGGEKQRVALGRALVREPKILLLDEPLSNLDAKLREHMRSELKELQRKIKVTTIIATPDPLEAMSMADRIAVMKDGKLQQYDTPENIYKKPKNLFVAEFTSVTTPNIVKCVIEKHGAKLLAKIAGNYFEITKNISISEDEMPIEATIFVKPSDVILRKDPREGAIEAQVKVIQFLGSKVVYDLDLNGIRIKAQSDEILAETGDILWVSFDLEKVIIFDGRGNIILG